MATWQANAAYAPIQAGADQARESATRGASGALKQALAAAELTYVQAVAQASEDQVNAEAQARRAHAAGGEVSKLDARLAAAYEKLRVDRDETPLSAFANLKAGQLTTLTQKWSSEDWAGKIAVLFDAATGGRSTEFMASEAFGKALDQIDGFLAGFSDAMTNGLSTRARAALWGDAATRNHQGRFFEAGRIAGMVYGVVIGFGNPCAMSSVGQIAFRVLNGLQAVGGLLNAQENFAKGKYLAAAGDMVGVIFNTASMLRACFAAGTPLLTPEGSRNIEDFKVGDLVLSRHEDDPNGEIVHKRVEDVFVRTGRILHLHVGGQVIRTTPEHPFWVSGKGWVEAGVLQVGDLVTSHDGRCRVVEDVFDTGEYETVYNVCVSDFHTYFVGAETWDFDIWAHNAQRYNVPEGADKATQNSVRRANERAKKVQQTQARAQAKAQAEAQAAAREKSIQDELGQLRQTGDQAAKSSDKGQGLRRFATKAGFIIKKGRQKELSVVDGRGNPVTDIPHGGGAPGTRRAIVKQILEAVERRLRN